MIYITQQQEEEWEAKIAELKNAPIFIIWKHDTDTKNGHSPQDSREKAVFEAKIKTLEEYNKMCAEFLGFKCSINEQYELPNMMILAPAKNSHLCRTAKVCCVEDMQFHSDWNWIMEVIEKIQTLDRLGGIVLIQQGRCKITSRMAGDHSVYADVSNYFLRGIKGQKEAVVQAIYEFLIWYNGTNK